MDLDAAPPVEMRAGGHAIHAPGVDPFRIETPGLRVRMASSAADHAAILALRAQAFRGSTPEMSEGDAFDPICAHVLVETRADTAEGAAGQVLAAFRLLHLRSGAALGTSYAAQFYDLSRLTRYPGRMAEIGRFCIAEACCDADVPRLAWAGLTRFVDAQDVQLLFGCASFPGTDPAPHAAALDWLARHHLAPERWRIGPRAAETHGYADAMSRREAPDGQAGLRTLPPLLRSYLALGGWVSDHAVIDRDLGTLHVFTGVEIARIPPARARALRRLAG